MAPQRPPLPSNSPPRYNPRREGQAVRQVEPQGESAREVAALTDAVEALLP